MAGSTEATASRDSAFSSDVIAIWWMVADSCAVEKTIAFPLDPWFQLGDPRLVLALLFLVVGFAWQALRRD